MSYLVLARKYRPQKFADLVGQEHVALTLKNAIKSDRAAHAYLFTGPRGVGKTSAARILAKALRCSNPLADAEPCNTCDSCEAINIGNSLDVIEIDAASNTGVDNIRELRESVGFMATQGKYRVYIIDEVHMLSTAAFNALLKTLEEPPPHVLFIFATTEIHKVPPTILSRCQRFDFKKIPSTVMTANLRSICSQEKIQIDDNSLKAIANESEGCLRDAQSLLDQAIAICGQNIELESLEKALGFVSRKQFFNLIEAIFNHDASLALKSSSTLMESGIDPKILLNRLTLFFRDLHFYFWTSHSAIDDAYTLEMMEKGRSTLSADEIIRALDLCLKTQTQLPLSSLASFALESLVAKLSLQRPAFLENNIAKSPATSAHAYSNNEQKPSLNFSNNAAKITQQVNSVASSNPQAAPSTTSDSTSLVSNVKISAEPLSQLEEYLRNQKSSWLPVLKSILSLDCSAEKVQVSVKADFAGKRLASKDGVELLKQVFSNPRVHVQVAESSDALRNNNRPEDIIQDKRRESREHVAVQEAIKAFKAVVKETKVLNDEKTK